jgi:7-cyano-7-deazaguanine reductase
MKKKPFKALGSRVTRFQGFETFPTPPGVTEVTMVSDEVTAVCPVTGQPDWYTVEINYAPDRRCLESKTLKLYLQSFRNAGHFCEKLASIICEELFEALKPHDIRVSIKQKSRGGVSIVATARKSQYGE